MKFAVGSSDCYSANPRPDDYQRFALACEEMGYNSFWMGDHVLLPNKVDISAYPYAERGFESQSSWPDPLISLTAAAAVTNRIRLGTAVAVTPYRPPLPLAQAIATLDLIADGRFIYGVGIGWMKEEFAALGVPFNERGARADEAIRMIRALWAGDEPHMEGKFYPVPDGRLWFSPERRATPRIYIGGEGDAAWRRTARLGDGLLIAYRQPAGMEKALDALKREFDAVGRDIAEIEIIIIGDPSYILDHQDEIAQHEKLGVSEISFVPKIYDIDRSIDLFSDVAKKLMS